MRVLGIDPGSTATGYGVVERSGGGLAHVAHGTLRASVGASLPVRLATLQAAIAEVIVLHEPDVVSVERVFVAASPRAALVLGHARGVVLAAAAAADLPVVEYAAREIKKAVVGAGGAQKTQVQAMVRLLLGLGGRPAQDAADALAAAICHAHANRLEALGHRPPGRRGRGRGFVVRRAR